MTGSVLTKWIMKLTQEEHAQLKSGQPGQASSLCVFLVEGIELQEHQRNIELFIMLNKYMTTTQEIKLQKKQTSLMK
ncbi:hypothetical protein K435DRAFT_855710 [Dendrothele bispora CBS 962.96]|uniref:Uncharacterized protein n=1 Tax=Dendrothele bispora (strain CBS 962.96) TaxID=1314807 RepID=A0A4V4HGM9_DENBC|nr:hypothetical protein K435DRAFT_855710 [Dendrothele bispora CBS 962.96]